MANYIVRYPNPVDDSFTVEVPFTSEAKAKKHLWSALRFFGMAAPLDVAELNHRFCIVIRRPAMPDWKLYRADENGNVESCDEVLTDA